MKSYLQLILFSTHIFYEFLALEINDYAIHNIGGCIIPDFDPFDPSYQHLFPIVDSPVCSRKPRVSFIRKDKNSGNLELVIDTNIIRKSYTTSKYKCCYNEIQRDPDEPEDKIKISTCYPIGQKVLLANTTEFILVSCQNLRPRTKVKVWYKNGHALIPDKLTVQSRLKEMNTSRKNKPISVLLLAMDSISRLNLKRSMPKTEKYLHDNNWVELKGYSKVGENTYPNEMAILTGMKPVDSYNICKPWTKHGLDDCNFIWKSFSDNGYVTAFGEDVAFLNTFNYKRKGFHKQPTDYYMRPFFLGLDSQTTGDEKQRFFCSGPAPAAHQIYNYALNFGKKFRDDPYFALLWTNSFSHDVASLPLVMDIDTVNFLDHLKSNGILNTSVVFLFSDHGIRLGDSKKAYTGFYEARLPMFFASFPPWFKKQYPSLIETFEQNTNRLTTPYDFHATLLHILALADEKADSLNFTATGCPGSSSLLRPISESRTCTEACLDDKWCTCGEFLDHDENSHLLKKMAIAAVDYLNLKYQCENLTLHRVVLGHSPNGMISNDLKNVVVFETLPGFDRFEATVTKSQYKHKTYLIVNDRIKRVSLHKSQSKCNLS